MGINNGSDFRKLLKLEAQTYNKGNKKMIKAKRRRRKIFGLLNQDKTQIRAMGFKFMIRSKRLQNKSKIDKEEQMENRDPT